ncbi:MAG: DUF1304 domain-containing protein, partial [Sideroxydans sp.]|nr:DUF1304 domain-containing protein [Sideroxydans sp.]
PLHPRAGMFLWTKSTGRKAFGLSKEFAAQTRTLAANQGLYNGFLAVGNPRRFGLSSSELAGYAHPSIRP